MSTMKKVLIVEDSPTVRYEIRLLLQKHGIVLLEAGNEQGMYINIEEYGICVDLVIMDLTLKYENGFDLIRKMKNNDKYKNIPILILTEHADVNNVIKARQLGVDGYVRKPIQKDEFLSRVNGILFNR
jgi:DNA-binding response OmpR family regulator